MDDPRNAKLFDLMESLYRILGQSEMMAYLIMMAPRLLEMHRILKPTGSLYLHCDQLITAASAQKPRTRSIGKFVVSVLRDEKRSLSINLPLNCGN